MNNLLPCRLPCCRCARLRHLRIDDLCGECGRASDAVLESDRRQDEHRASKVALERALGLEVRAA